MVIFCGVGVAQRVRSLSIKMVHIKMSHIKTITDPIIWVFLCRVGGAQRVRPLDGIHKNVPLHSIWVFFCVEWVECGVNLCT